MFYPQDLSYAQNVSTLDDVYRLVSDKVLKETDNRDRYISQLKEKEAVITNKRANGILLLNNIRSDIRRNFIHIFILKSELFVQRDLIRMIVVYNSMDKTMEGWVELSSHVMRLLHASDMVFNFDHDHDYRLLCEVMNFSGNNKHE